MNRLSAFLALVFAVLLIGVGTILTEARGYGQGRRIQTPFPQAAPQQQIPALSAAMKIRMEDDLVTAELQNVPIQQALEEFAARTGVVFEVATQENDPISMSFYKATFNDAVRRLVGTSNCIVYYAKNEAGRSQVQFVRMLYRSNKTQQQASLRYIGTGAITKTGDDTVDNPEQALRALAESKNVEARQKAVEILVAAKGIAAVQALTKAVEDEAPEVRAAAIEGLASLGARNALPQIVQHLKDPHPGVRQSSINAVALIGDAENLNDLRPLGRDKDKSVAAAAEIAIKKLSMHHP